MKLSELTAVYIDYKRSLGMRFNSDASTLKSFCRTMGNVDLDEIDDQAVNAFLAGTGPITAYWHQKYTVLKSFYRYAIERGHTDRVPLPTLIPKRPVPLTPYIYSSAELQHLLAATEQLHNPNSPLQSLTFRTLLLLLYGSAMRIGEALSLTLADVNLPERLVTVRDAKFHKSRLVPIGPKLTQELAVYVDQRRVLPLPQGEGSAFIATRTGHGLSYHRASALFRRIRTAAGVCREPGARYQPRLHDIRHTAAVDRIVAWYRAGSNVQRMLLPLSTYLGHVDIQSTQRYLSMTPELLNEAGHRFEHYAKWGIRHD